MMTMLRGDQIILRPVRAADLEELYGHHIEIANRGDYFPIGVMGEPTFQKRFQENGFWDRDEGMLVILEAAAPDPPRDRARQRAVSTHRREVWLHPRRHDSGAILPSRQEHRRLDVLAAAHRSASLAARRNGRVTR